MLPGAVTGRVTRLASTERFVGCGGEPPCARAALGGDAGFAGGTRALAAGDGAGAAPPARLPMGCPPGFFEIGICVCGGAGGGTVGVLACRVRRGGVAGRVAGGVALTALPVGAARLRCGVFAASAFSGGALPAGSGLAPRAREPGNAAAGWPEGVPALRGATAGLRSALSDAGSPWQRSAGLSRRPWASAAPLLPSSRGHLWPVAIFPSLATSASMVYPGRSSASGSI
jgi:hypothetical protein